MPSRERNRADQQAYRRRMREKGHTQILLTVPERYAVPLRRLAGEMRDKDPADIDLVDSDAAGRAAAAEACVKALEAGRSRDRQRAWKALRAGRRERERALAAERLVEQLQTELHETKQTLQDRERTIGRIEGDRDRAQKQRDQVRQERDEARKERDEARKERDQKASAIPPKADREALKTLKRSGWRVALARHLLGL